MNFLNFRDYNYINNLVYHNLQKIPEDVDLVVGIPRSGLQIANMICEFRNLPMLTIFEYLNDVVTYKFNAGSIAPQNTAKEYKKILLVDDCVGVGLTMANAKQTMLAKNSSTEIITCAAFVEPAHADVVDIYFEQLTDQFMPWSVMKRGISFACVDIDGILTEDVPPGLDENEEEYIKYITDQKPIFIPDRPIHTLVTGRLAKYKDITVDWLTRHNIKFYQLAMCPCNTNAERAQLCPANFKAHVYKSLTLPLFIESDLYEAKVIAQTTHKPVYCAAISNMIYL